MNKTWKRLLSMVIVLCMVFSIVPFNAFAAEFVSEGKEIYLDIQDGMITKAELYKLCVGKWGEPYEGSLVSGYYWGTSIKDALDALQVTGSSTGNADSLENNETYSVIKTVSKTNWLGTTASLEDKGKITVRYYYVVTAEVADGAPEGAGVTVANNGKVYAGKEATLTVNQVDGYTAQVLNGKTVEANLNDTDGYTCTYKPNATVKLTVKYTKVEEAAEPATVNIAVEGKGTVKVGDLTQKGTLPAGDYDITATPADGSYVASVTVDGEDASGSYDANANYAFTDGLTVESGKTYNVKVVFSEYAIGAKDDQTIAVNGYSKMETDDLKNKVLTAVLPYDDFNADDYTVKMAVSAFGHTGYLDIEAYDQRLILGALDIGESESFQIIRKGTDRYPEVTETVSVKVVESRGEAKIYHNGNTYTALSLDTVDIKNDLTISEGHGDVEVKHKPGEMAAPGETAEITYTVTVAENEKFVKTTKDVKVQVTTPKTVVKTENDENKGTVSYEFAEGEDSIALTVKPFNEKGYYVSDVTVNGTSVLADGEFGDNGVFTRTANVKKSETNTVVVSYGETTITAEDCVINVYEYDTVEEQIGEILKAITGTNPNPLPNGTYVVEYKAVADRGSSILGVDLSDYQWQAVEESNIPDGILSMIKGYYHAFGNDQETVRISYKSADGKYIAVSNEFTVTLTDVRKESKVDVAESIEMTYGQYTTEELLEKLLVGHKGACNAETGEAIEVAQLSIDTDVKALDVGEYTLTVCFDGNNDYAKSSAKVALTINKAKASVSVDSAAVKYADIKGSEHAIDDQITVDPEDVDYATFAVGLQLGANASADAGAVAYVDLPALIDVDAIENESIKGLVQAALDAFNGSIKLEMSVTEMKDVLTEALNSLQKIEDISGINLNTESISTLVNVLNQIENLEGVGNLTVKLTMDKGIDITDSGVYLVGAVTSDANYETTYGLNYLIVTPDGHKAELDWIIEDENGFVTYNAIHNGSYDLGAKVTKVYEGTVEAAEKQLVELFIGIDANGNPVLTNDQNELNVGAYTEIAYIRDLGNEMYYAVPLARPVVVVADVADVQFIDENGNVNNDRLFTFDGQPHAMKAVATNRAGEQLPEENITVLYIGIEGDGEGYYNEEAPSKAGVYTVIATYADNDAKIYGMAAGAMAIEPAAATISVSDKVHTYDGETVDVLDMIEKTPDDAKMVVIMAGLDVNGDFSENGLSAVDGVVNVDFPARVDEILKKYVPTAYSDGIKLSTFTSKLETIRNALEKAGLDTDALDQVVELLNQVPDKTTLTFKEQSEVNPTNIGTYVVVAAIMDPDYKADMDAGILVIAPEVTEAELQWNYNDLNGIITRPILDKIDMGATAYVENAADAALTERIEYIIVGVDSEGNTIVQKNADVSKLPNGVYTQMAYITEEVSADMTVVKPIVRTFTIVNQTVEVNAPVKSVVYTGQQPEYTVTVKDAAGNEITGDRLENLTVRYVGVDTVNGVYDSTEVPTNVGVYTVIAEYVEYDENGELAYCGADIGKLTIQPADMGVIVKDASYTYDGNEKNVPITVPAGAEYIEVIVDEDNNVNIVLPASWGVGSKTFDVAGGIQQLLAELAKLPDSVADSEVIEALEQVLNSIEIKTLSINGKLPVEVGEYDVTVIAYAANYKVAVGNATLTITEKTPEETTQPTDPEETTQPTDPEETTQPTDPEETTQPTDPEETTQPTDPEETTQPTDPEETTKSTEPEETTKPSGSDETTEATESTTKSTEGTGTGSNSGTATGDNAPVLLLSMLMFASLAAALVLLLAEKRRRR